MRMVPGTGEEGQTQVRKRSGPFASQAESETSLCAWSGSSGHDRGVRAGESRTSRREPVDRLFPLPAARLLAASRAAGGLTRDPECHAGATGDFTGLDMVAPAP